jgi:hypothetical protein
MRQIEDLCVALQGYERSHGALPPAHLSNAAGPVCSWRLLALPYLDAAIDLTAYRKDLPWNDPNNRPVADHGLYPLECPNASYRDVDNYTSYFYLTDYCTEDRVVLIEEQNAGVAWAEPRDLSLRDLRNLLAGRSSGPRAWFSEDPAIAIVHAGGYRVVRVHGSGVDAILGQIHSMIQEDARPTHREAGKHNAR